MQMNSLSQEKLNVGVFGTRKWPIREGGKTNPVSDLSWTRNKYRQIVSPTH